MQITFVSTNVIFQSLIISRNIYFLPTFIFLKMLGITDLSIAQPLLDLPNYFKSPDNYLLTIRDVEKNAEFLRKGYVCLLSILNYCVYFATPATETAWGLVIKEVQTILADLEQLLLAFNILDAHISEVQLKGIDGLYHQLSQIFDKMGMPSTMKIRSMAHTDYIYSVTQFLYNVMQRPLPSPVPTAPYPAPFPFSSMTQVLGLVSSTLATELDNFDLFQGDNEPIVDTINQVLYGHDMHGHGL